MAGRAGAGATGCVGDVAGDSAGVRAGGGLLQAETATMAAIPKPAQARRQALGVGPATGLLRPRMSMNEGLVKQRSLSILPAR